MIEAAWIGRAALDLGRSIEVSFNMFWDTLWALVLGFTISGAVQAFVSRESMQRRLGRMNLKSGTAASLFGMASSSCSYAASAMTRSLFKKGADFTVSMIFMFASTNLVIELGIVLIVLVGWQFALSELVGGAIMIVLLAVVGPRVFRGKVLAGAEQASGRGSTIDEPASEVACQTMDREGSDSRGATGKGIRSLSGWANAAGFSISDMTMLRKEMVIGFTVAGLLAKLVPSTFWSAAFLHGHGFLTEIENAVIGPAIAVISFVCSVGNVPMAAALWGHGIQFGGVVSFIFADLITLPLILVYRKMYGTRMAMTMAAVFWSIMSVAGLAVEEIFKATGLVPSSSSFKLGVQGVGINWATGLDLLAISVFLAELWLYRNASRFGGGAGYAKDLVCQMQVEMAHAPASFTYKATTYYFCAEHCKDRFEANPDSFIKADRERAQRGGPDDIAGGDSPDLVQLGPRRRPAAGGASD